MSVAVVYLFGSILMAVGSGVPIGIGIAWYRKDKTDHFAWLMQLATLFAWMMAGLFFMAYLSLS